MTIKQWFFKIIGKTPDSMPMVEYWKSKAQVEAKVMRGKDGATIMQMSGEKHPFPGFPRGHILFGSLSKLKHEIKNRIFNDSWKMLEEGKSHEEVVERIRTEVFPYLRELFEPNRVDIVPPSSMCVSVKEIHRAWEKVAPGPNSILFRDMICHILQEDDGYRFRFQWLVTYFNPSSFLGRFFDPLKGFEKALTMLEHGEIIGDMKERIRLLRRILITMLRDPHIRGCFKAFCKEVDWNKVKLSEADKYFFRGKWFKVDLDKFEY